MVTETKPTTERLTLTVTEVFDRKPAGVSGGTKREFKARTAEGADPMLFTIWKSDLDAAVTIGATIQADVQVKEKHTDRATFIDRVVQQIYVDGQPLHVRGSGVAGGRSDLQVAAGYGIDMYFRSLAQGAVTDRIVCLFHKSLEWCERALGVNTSAPTGVMPPTPTPAPVPNQAPMPSAGAMTAGGNPAQLPRKAGAETVNDGYSAKDFKTSLDLERACFHLWRLQPAQVWKELGYGSKQALSPAQLYDAYLKIKASRRQ